MPLSDRSNGYHRTITVLGETAASILAVGQLQAVTVWVNGYTNPDELLTLYSSYKEECVHYVDAASSFILHDRQADLLIAVRDLLGVYPLFYADTPHQLLIGFSVRDIMVSKQVPIRINATALRDYLDSEAGGKPITNQTFYQHVYSLLPAHALLWQQAGQTIKPYCQLRLHPLASLPDNEYVHHFKERFLQSVQSVLKPSERVAAHLSGGLDSSSVCGVLQAVSTDAIHSFFIKTDTEATHEEAYVEAVLEKSKLRRQPINHHDVRPGSSAYQSAETYTAITGQPSQLLLPVATFLPVLAQAKQLGCTVLLSGHGGDQVAGYGFDYLDDLFDRKDWASLKIALNQYADNRRLKELAGNIPFKDDQEKRQVYTARYFLTKAKQATNWRTRSTIIRTLLTHFDWRVRPLYRLIHAKITRRKKASLPALPNLLRANWANEQANPSYRALDSRQLVAGDLLPWQRQQIEFVYGSLGIQYNEAIAQLQAQYGLKTAHPFLDRKLLEVSLATPRKLLFNNGLGRGLLRKSMSGYLPEEVANRLDKGEFSAYTHEAFHSLWAEFNQRNHANHPVWEYVDSNTFRAMVAVVLDDQYTIRERNAYRFMASRVIYLAIWLDYLRTLSS